MNRIFTIFIAYVSLGQTARPLHMLSKLMREAFGNNMMENTSGVNLPQSIAFEFIRDDVYKLNNTHWSVVGADIVGDSIYETLNDLGYLPANNDF